MPAGIIVGTGFESLRALLPANAFYPEAVTTRYGAVTVLRTVYSDTEFFILPRHGEDHSIPPHQINYRANLKALHQLGVTRILATFAVGSIAPSLPPGSAVVIDQFLDFTTGRVKTFYDGGASGVVHTSMTYPYCSALRERVLAVGPTLGLSLVSQGTYVCTDGPRLETAAEIRMFAKLGGDVIGMTGVPEVCLARELGLHYAAIAYSVNWAAGLEPGQEITFLDEELTSLKQKLLLLCFAALQTEQLSSCRCTSTQIVLYPPDPTFFSE
jgi:5'-methylthioadenosine phosphorylase